jgi:hypothetical protein
MPHLISALLTDKRAVGVLEPEAVRDVVCRVTRFSFETGRVLAQYIHAAEPQRSESPDPRR